MISYYLLLLVNNTPLNYRNGVRNFVFKNFKWLLRDLAVHKEWSSAQDFFYVKRDSRVSMVNLQKIAPCTQNGSIAIHFHVYYVDLIGEVFKYLNASPIKFDLLISTTTEENLKTCVNEFKKCSSINQIIGKVVKNQGRDLAPLICEFGEILIQYDFFAHIHTKKSLGVNSIGNEWRKYLYSSLLSKQNVTRIMSLLQEYGIAYPETFQKIGYQDLIWGSSYKPAADIARRMGVNPPADGFVHFPAGSMFWAQTKAFLPLLNLGITLEEFEPELGQSGGTLAHSIERMLCFIPISENFSAVTYRPII